MNYFNYVNNRLSCENVSVASIAETVGTPFYLYSHKTLMRHFEVFDQAFSPIPHRICFSAKANSNVAILRALVKAGAGVDIVSGGELFRALQAGCPPDRIVYSGVGKRDDEIVFALEKDILMFNIESPQELAVINDMAGRLGLRARISIRVNPDVNPHTHPHISTGLRENKFGIDIEQSLEYYRQARELSNIDIIGVACHIGSQITDIAPFVDTLDRLKKLIGLLRQQGIDVRYLDLGGGLGITYNKEAPPHPTEYASALMAEATNLGVTLILEPGRVIVGNAGVLVTKVLYIKEGGDKHFIVVDAGMNDLARPSLYGSYHEIQPVIRQGTGRLRGDVVGPICESTDFFAKNRDLDAFKRGDLAAVMSAGAYGFSMSSNYNSRPRVAEVMVIDDEFFIIRNRESYDDLIRGEAVPESLR
ncbi:MAG: diaminopimelate decarboxylase [Deltaproteobacteria bacterium]|nr:diaminopimelate decarboxylase [Deltaproteobacteria bacterium]